jgi:hypothetical protein
MVRQCSWALMLTMGMLVVSCAVPTAQPGIPPQAAIATHTPVVVVTEPTMAAPTSTLTPTKPPTPIPTPRLAPTELPTPTPSPVVAQPITPTPGSGGPRRLNLEEILPPPAEMRELVVMNCLGCHGLGEIVLGQKPATHWEWVRLTHMEIVRGLGMEQFNEVFKYLVENFNETKPEPELPDWYPDRTPGYV